MYHFTNDYNVSACPQIMHAMQEDASQKHVGYGKDAHCEKAAIKIQHRLKNKNCDIHFLVGGTQSNLTMIAAALRPHEAIISVDSGHINVHETGAIEASGHKIICVPSLNGLLDPNDIYPIVKKHNDEHMVKIKMVYISNATELGTIYQKQQLKKLRAVCDELDLLLFLDGARLGAAMNASNNDVLWSELCEYLDVFYIGGTKNGALFGEAMIIVNPDLKKDFRYIMKQNGAMLAKGWLLGLQFSTLFEDHLLDELAKHANCCAQKMQEAIIDANFPLLHKTTTNQIFMIANESQREELAKQCTFEVWDSLNQNKTVLRFVTSWDTSEREVAGFIKCINQLRQNAY